MEELISDLKELNVPGYSSPEFFDSVKSADRADTRTDRQVQLYWDGRGTSITRSELIMDNMTPGTSL